MNDITDYIKDKYNPLALIVYGSYANGTNNLNSDFDALVISAQDTKFHDTSFVGDVQLDVFVYPKCYFDGEFDCEDFVQIFDGIILKDTDGVGTDLKDKVLAYLESKPEKSYEEIKADVSWCIKMWERVKRGDTEGMFRFHWLLIDSLEIFCNVVHHPYSGPKKALLWMEDNHPTAFEYYRKALSEFSLDSLNDWILYLRNVSCGE